MLSWRKERKQGESRESEAVDDNAAAKPAAEPSLDAPVNPRARLGEMLVQEGVITQSQLDEALTLQQDQGGFLGNTLVSLRYIDQNTLVSFLVKQCKIPHISLLDYGVNEDLFKLVPKELCLEHLCIPIDQLGKILTVAMVNPFDADALESVRATCPDLKIKPILCDYNHFDQVARKHLSTSTTEEDEGEDVSAQSFGLSPLAPAKTETKVVPKKEPVAAKEPTPSSAAVKPSAPAAPAGKSIDADVLAVRLEAALTTGLNDALAPLLSSVASIQSAKPAALDVEALATAVASALREPIDSLAKAQQTSAPALDVDGLAAQLERSITGGMHEAIAPLHAFLKSAREVEPAPTNDRAIADSIVEALREPLSALAKAQEPRDTPDPLIGAIAALQQAVESINQPAPATNVEEFPEPESQTKRRKPAKKKREKPGDSEVLTAAGVVPQGDDSVREALLESPLCSAYTFDDFFAGPSNTVTESLVRGLPETPDPGLSPLYLGGGVGLGKTHLLHAIGNAYTDINPDVRVRRMTAGMFIRACEKDASGGGLQAFLETFSTCDVLLMDDVHLFAGRDDVQAAFVELFDALCGAGRVVAITGLDRGDGARGLSAQLQSRLSGAVVAMIKPPEFETRIEILRHFADESGVDVPEEILTLIAEQVSDDVRRLKGAFEKVSAYVRVVGDGVSAADARDMIVQFGAGAVA